MRSTVLIMLLAAVLSAGACGCKGKEAAPAKDSKAAAVAVEAPVPVDVADVKTMDVKRTVDFVGTLEAFEEAAVGCKVEAQVARVHVDMGDRVAQGALLVSMDDEAFRIKEELAQASLREAVARLGVTDERDVSVENVSFVKKAKAELADAERNLNRMADLEKKGYISRSQYDDAQVKRDVMKANLDTQIESARSMLSTIQTKRASLALAKKELKDTSVRAPFAGFVSRKLVDNGDYAKVGAELVHIVSVDPIKLRGEIPEVYAADIKNGQTVDIRLSALPGRGYTGKISRISPSSSRDSRAFMVEVRVPNPGGLMKPGYFAEASVAAGMKKDAMVVPVNSIISFAGVNKVYVAEGGKAAERVVTPGARVGESVEVSGGLKAGDKVITTGTKRLYAGKTVIVRESH